MKVWITTMLMSIFLIGCTMFNGDENGNREQLPKETEENSTGEGVEETVRNEITIDVFSVNGKEVVAVDQLMEKIDGMYEFDEVNRSLTMEVADREFFLVDEIPVLEVNGEYLATDEITLQIDEEMTPHVTVGFVEKGLETEVNDVESNLVTFVWEEEVIQAWSPANREEFDLFSLSVEEMIDYLSFLEKPIEGAQVSTQESHLPGAPRPYRNGTHEGIDWYEHTSGTAITTDTPIYAMGEGIVVRADHDFIEYKSPEVRNEDLELSAELGLTPEYILDRLRGKQVWVQYDNGIMNRFAHLDRIPDDIRVGDKVDAETIIGYVGNTGSSHSVNGDGGGLHLHQDLLIYGELFWEPYTPEEVQQILRAIWE
ncbi:murein DD-endopeptidase MepM/ murein hydrolase activator NlpD [Evansella vedderi]|uniref:Murein DD-endopeptidase MepM/ murein hydrolase activator NlpD n=1 Tax=Evansella vedderi TaxID=38282 RepID=A0ABT9ZRL8_9BACI|nr:M23 family metallopeptidase [Evansella vedderi]MDQ0253875.1 murein DD-endopeptidase MepM/ murein hydrolase activator NlpD [Evansella vedderi]